MVTKIGEIMGNRQKYAKIERKMEIKGIITF